MCSFHGLDFRFNKVKFGTHEINVQCHFLKVRGDLAIVKQVISRSSDNVIPSDSESPCVMISTGDYITLKGLSSRVYVVTEVTEEDMVCCVLPINAVNKPTMISMDKAMVALLRQCS
jgi:hypothetical protein